MQLESAVESALAVDSPLASRAIGAASLLDDPQLRAAVLKFVRAAFWQYAWPELKTINVHATLWIFRPSVKVEHLRWFFVKVFGEPADVGVNA